MIDRQCMNTFEEMLEDQIKDIIKKGDITPAELDSIYKASAIILDFETREAMNKQYEMEGYSQRGSYGNSMRGSYRQGGYDGASNHYPWYMYYDNGNMSRGNSYGWHPEMEARYMRESRDDGMYSRSMDKDRMISKLHEMMEEAPSEKERRTLQQCIEKLERP